MFVILLVFFLSSYEKQSANAETEIPLWLKNQIRSWSTSQASDRDFVDSLFELNKIGMIRANISITDQNTYQLPRYGETVFVKIAGKTGDYEQTSPVILIVVDPEGQKSEYTIPVLESSAYSTVIPITHNSASGTYTVFAYHVGKEISKSYFHIRDEPHVPSWVRNVAKWLADGKISDRDFVLSMQYLLDNKIIEFNLSPTLGESTLDVSITGLKAVRRGTAQFLDIHVENTLGPVDGATVFVRIENYDEEILDEFDGITNSDGNYNLSWEISEDFNDIETLLVFIDVTDGVSSKTALFKFQAYCLCGEPNCKCRN